MLFDEEYWQAPFDIYATLHEKGPVHRVCLPDGIPVWLVTGYTEVYDALRDQRLARHRKYANDDYTNHLPPEGLAEARLVMEDPPDHTKSRKLVNHGFVPRRMRLLKPVMEKLVSDLLDDVAAKGADGAIVDLMDTFCAPLPITVICDLVGVPDEERVHVREWGELVFSHNLVNPQGIGAAMARALVARRTDPKDDLLTVWAEVADDDGNLLPPEDLSHMALIMFAAGYDSTMGMLSCSTLALMQRPDLAKRLADAGEDELHRIMEEMFRMYSPTQRGFRRFAREDMEIGGQRISAGDTVLLSIGAADRDPSAFPNANDLDFDRAQNKHLVFGRGPHACPGAELARIENGIALQQLFRRFPEISLAVPEDELPWRESTLIRLPLSLPVTIS
ncbi:cytochrome P450 [Actinophytocola sp.]|uniref:cytochrome P450 n=1 Tax=Actinophytocola sp. TaxID=1872138 RepID=UPI002D240333|nr:cytochrome P450 [Actinophytocola sp.]HYQ67777.1 cytochrome P450 [Actinophytocola sp.]